MFKRVQWLAVVRGKRWTLAKIVHRKLKVNILWLSEFRGESSIQETNGEQFGELLDNDTELDRNQETNAQSQDSHVGQCRNWLLKQKVPLKKLRLAISCPGIIIRIITLPLMSSKDLKTLLTDRVDQYFTLNIADYLVDYRLVQNFKEDGQMRQRILLAAIPRYHWEQILKTFEEIGIKPKVVDLAADSLTRLYGKLSAQKVRAQVNGQSVQFKDIAVIDLEADRVEFILLEEGKFFLYSDLEVDLRALDGLVLPKESKEKSEFDGEGLSQERLHDEVENVIAPVLRTLEEFLTFFAARHFGKSIDRIFLTGEYADCPFLAELFETNLEIEAYVGFPHNWRPYFSPKVRGKQQEWMKYGSLYGLALRED